MSECSVSVLWVLFQYVLGRKMFMFTLGWVLFEWPWVDNTYMYWEEKCWCSHVHILMFICSHVSTYVQKFINNISIQSKCNQVLPSSVSKRRFKSYKKYLKHFVKKTIYKSYSKHLFEASAVMYRVPCCLISSSTNWPSIANWAVPGLALLGALINILTFNSKFEYEFWFEFFIILH